jgi:hypothetical protein
VTSQLTCGLSHRLWAPSGGESSSTMNSRVMKAELGTSSRRRPLLMVVYLHSGQAAGVALPVWSCPCCRAALRGLPRHGQAWCRTRGVIVLSPYMIHGDVCTDRGAAPTTHRRSTFSQTPSNQAPCAPPDRLGAALLYATPTRSPSLKGCAANSFEHVFL